MSNEDIEKVVRILRPRGKWDFDSDDMRLHAHTTLANADQWDRGWRDGYKCGRTRALQTWPIPLSFALVMIAAIVCWTVLAIKRPGIVAFTSPTLTAPETTMICYNGNVYWNSVNGICRTRPDG